MDSLYYGTLSYKAIVILYYDSTVNSIVFQISKTLHKTIVIPSTAVCIMYPMTMDR